MAAMYPNIHWLQKHEGETVPIPVGPGYEVTVRRCDDGDA